MKTLRIPRLPDCADLDTALETGGGVFHVECVNWPSEYPYAPFCAGRTGHTEDSLVVDFRVSGLDLRAMNTADQGRSWEDSACEIFLQVPGDTRYYNFETNPAGKIVACCGPDRYDRTPIPEEKLASIGRRAFVEAPVEHAGGVWNWRVVLTIPFDVLGVAAPSRLLGNIYKCGDLTAHPHFLTWAPIDTPKPDFHRPEFFGEFILE